MPAEMGSVGVVATELRSAHSRENWNDLQQFHADFTANLNVISHFAAPLTSK